MTVKGFTLPVKVVWLTVKVGHAAMYRFPIDFNGFGLPVKVSGCP